MLEVLASVNLSLSSACGADCVFCPDDRGSRLAKKHMSMEVAGKIIDEITSPFFVDKYKTSAIHIGENGDCFLNKATIDILRRIKFKKPDMAVFVWTDMQFFTPDKMEIIVRERLLDFVGLNIDGASEQSFTAVKRLSSKYTREYLPIFIELREKYGANIPLAVQSLTMRHYVDSVRTHLGRNPIRVKDPALLEIEDDFEEIKAYVTPMLKPQDRFSRSSTMFWAERPQVAPASLDYASYSCPLISRVTREAFIAPDGTWYACCFDSNNQLSLGNVYDTSVDAVAQGDPRMRLVKLLTAKRFGDIGGPCATVNCCQIGIPEPKRHVQAALPLTVEKAAPIGGNQTDGPTQIVRPAEDPLAAAEARLEVAITQARRGDFAAARTVVATEVGANPKEMRILHKAGVVMRLCGDGEVALAFFSRALDAHPNFHFTQIEIAGVYADRGETDEALIWYRNAIASAPEYPISYLRAAYLERELGRSWDGLQLLERLHGRSPDHIDCNLLRAEFLEYHGMRVEVAQAYAAAIAAGCTEPMVQLSYMRVLTELADYNAVLDYTSHLSSMEPMLAFHAAVWAGHAKLALGVDEAGLVAVAMEREKSSSWLSVEGTHSRLLAAIHSRKPLSLIRLGDGEARFLAFFDPPSQQLVSQHEMECMLDLHWQNWFDVSLSSVSPDNLRPLAGAFMDALYEADILGIATAERYGQDTIHRGYFNALERAIESVALMHPAVQLTDAFVHIGLHRASWFYEELLLDLDFLGVISPHPGLAAKLAQYHRIADWNEYIVPGETRLPVHARSSSTAAHFPNRYLEILAGLHVPRQGAVFLVAAGLLGKVYCHRIQQLGGIALDIGSIVDAWMGFSTRPGQYEPRGEWILPNAPEHRDRSSIKLGEESR